MKQYRHLWADFISPANIDLAARNAVRSKKSKSDVRRFLGNRDWNIRALRETLIAGDFHTSPYVARDIFEPKKRTIYILPLYPDHIVHHALINILGPIWQSLFIRDSFACIPGRGLHAASKRVMEFIRRNSYVLNCDIRKFYPSMDHEIMMNIIGRKVGDKRILAILDDIVHSCGDGKNIPIGNLTSQWLGNVYLNELDMFVKHTLHWRDYIRYCDDFCLFGNDKGALHDACDKIREFLATRLRLTFSRASVYPVSRGVDFIGYRHFRDYILLRKRGARKMRRRIMAIGLHNDTGDYARGQLSAAYGWSRWACTYNWRRRVCHNVGCIATPRTTRFVRRFIMGADWG